MFLTLLFVLGLAGSYLARTPGVDTAVQQLFNSPGSQYQTDFTRDIVPVHPTLNLS